MRAIITWGGGLCGLLLATSVSFGYTWVTPVYRVPIPPAPDTYGPYFVSYSSQGMCYAPNYYLVPPWAPFQGHLPGGGPFCNTGGPGPGYGPGPGPGGGPAGPGGIPMPATQFPNPGPQNRQNYPSHPFARGPRDFFMWNETLEEQRGRDGRPLYVP